MWNGWFVPFRSEHLLMNEAEKSSPNLIAHVGVLSECILSAKSVFSSASCHMHNLD